MENKVPGHSIAEPLDNGCEPGSVIEPSNCGNTEISRDSNISQDMRKERYPCLKAALSRKVSLLVLEAWQQFGSDATIEEGRGSAILQDLSKEHNYGLKADLSFKASLPGNSNGLAHKGLQQSGSDTTAEEGRGSDIPQNVSTEHNYGLKAALSHKASLPGNSNGLAHEGWQHSGNDATTEEDQDSDFPKDLSKGHNSCLKAALSLKVSLPGNLNGLARKGLQHSGSDATTEEDLDSGIPQDMIEEHNYGLKAAASHKASLPGKSNGLAHEGWQQSGSDAMTEVNRDSDIPQDLSNGHNSCLKAALSCKVSLLDNSNGLTNKPWQQNKTSSDATREEDQDSDILQDLSKEHNSCLRAALSRKVSLPGNSNGLANKPWQQTLAASSDDGDGGRSHFPLANNGTKQSSVIGSLLSGKGGPLFAAKAEAQKREETHVSNDDRSCPRVPALSLHGDTSVAMATKKEGSTVTQHDERLQQKQQELHILLIDMTQSPAPDLQSSVTDGVKSSRPVTVNIGQEEVLQSSSDMTRDNSVTESRSLSNHERNLTGDKAYECDFCDMCFSLLGDLTQHRRIHTGNMPYHCDQCNKSFTQSATLVQHKRIHTRGKRYQRHGSSKSLNQSANLVRHKRIHPGEKPYKCDICNKRFTRSATLREHKRIHTGDKPYHCDLCNKRFTRSTTLAEHKRIHTEDTPYNCDQCNKSFSQRGTLVEHQRIHTGEQLYPCDQCNKSFTRSRTLEEHKRIHTGDKPYQCDQCNKSFGRSSNLSKHKLIHIRDKPYQCEFCGVCFSGLEDLTRHSGSHTGNKAYPCDQCSKSFAWPATLLEHKRIHKENNPYRCDQCNKSFTTLGNLTRHIQNHK